MGPGRSMGKRRHRAMGFLAMLLHSSFRKWLHWNPDRLSSTVGKVQDVLSHAVSIVYHCVCLQMYTKREGGAKAGVITCSAPLASELWLLICTCKICKASKRNQGYSKTFESIIESIIDTEKYLKIFEVINYNHPVNQALSPPSCR